MDLDEIQIKDLPEAKQFVFISCWATGKTESIPLWFFYGSGMKGVRLKLPRNMFAHGDGPHRSKDDMTDFIILKSLNNTFQRSKNEDELIPYIYGPSKVEYTDKNSVDCLLSDSQVDLKKFGTVKSKGWNFEKEIRFLIIPNHIFWDNDAFQIDKKRSKEPLLDKFIDIQLNPDCLNSMEVTLGPGVAEAESIIVQSLLKSEAPDASLRESTFNGKIQLNR